MVPSKSEAVAVNVKASPLENTSPLVGLVNDTFGNELEPLCTLI